MRHAFLVVMLPALAGAVAVAACSGASSTKVTEEEVEAGADPEVPPPDDSTPSNVPSGPAGSGLATGLPCEVQGIIENTCIACHSGEYPPPILDYAQLTAKSTKDPNKTRAQLSLEMMKAGAMPPKPAVPAEADEIAAWEEWVNGGTKKNPESCTDAPPGAGGDGGTTPKPDGGPLVDAGTDANPGGGGGAVCTSGKTWTEGNRGSPLMNPGEACMACHQQQGGPRRPLRLAGTVFPTLHEPDDCLGSPPPVTVIVTDSRNREFKMEVNASGNFMQESAGGILGRNPRPPFRAVIESNGKTRAMQGRVNSGDCNSCHTVAGTNGAPGRIMAP